MKTNPVFRVTAITHRRDAVFETVSSSSRTMELTDSAQLCALRTEVQMWRSLESAALQDGPKYFEELMGAIGSDDSRDVILALEELREKGELDRRRDDGRYVLAHASDRVARDRT